MDPATALTTLTVNPKGLILEMRASCRALSPVGGTKAVLFILSASHARPGVRGLPPGWAGGGSEWSYL